MGSIKLSQSENQTLTTRGYKLLSKIGEGAYAQVFLSSYKESSYKLACKIVDVPKSSATYINKFLPRELNILMAIKSPHIVHIHSIFRRNLKYFIFMRYAENGDLMDWIIENGAISQVQSKMWGKQIVAGIQYLHTNHIAHRDLKCENILITDKNNIKLTDFGFSRYINESNSKVSFSETFCGSLLYVAPEIVKGVAYNPFKSDIWSLGVVLFTMLNCKVPFNETNPSLIYELQIGQKYRFSNTDPSLADVKILIKRLLQPEPKKRPSVDIVLADNWFANDFSQEELEMELRQKYAEKSSAEINEMNVKQWKEPSKSSLVQIMQTDTSVCDDAMKNDAGELNENTEEVRKEKEESVDGAPAGIQIISKKDIDGD